MKYNGKECKVIDTMGNISLIEQDGVKMVVSTRDIVAEEKKKTKK